MLRRLFSTWIQDSTLATACHVKKFIEMRRKAVKRGTSTAFTNCQDTKKPQA